MFQDLNFKQGLWEKQSVVLPQAKWKRFSLTLRPNKAPHFCLNPCTLGVRPCPRETKGGSERHFLLLLLHSQLICKLLEVFLDSKLSAQKLQTSPKQGLANLASPCGPQVFIWSQGAEWMSPSPIAICFVLYYHSLVPFCIRLTASLHSFESKYLWNVYCILGWRDTEKE